MKNEPEIPLVIIRLNCEPAIKINIKLAAYSKYSSVFFHFRAKIIPATIIIIRNTGFPTLVCDINGLRVKNTYVPSIVHKTNGIKTTRTNASIDSGNRIFFSQLVCIYCANRKRATGRTADNRVDAIIPHNIIVSQKFLSTL